MKYCVLWNVMLKAVVEANNPEEAEALAKDIIKAKEEVCAMDYKASDVEEIKPT